MEFWGFTYALKPFLKVGFQVPFSHNQGVYVFNPLATYNALASLNTANTWKEKVKIAGLAFLAKLKSLLTFQAIDTSNHITFDTLNDKSVLIQEALTADKNFTLLQDRQYLDWRLFNNPYPNTFFEVSIKDSANKIVANCTCNIVQNNIGYIDQMIFADLNNEAVASSLIHAAIEEFKKRKVCAIRFWGFDFNSVHKKEVKLLEKAGFLFVNKGSGFVWWKPKSSDLDCNHLFLNRIFTQGNR